MDVKCVGHTGQWSWFPTGLLIRWSDWGPGQVRSWDFVFLDCSSYSECQPGNHEMYDSLVLIWLSLLSQAEATSIVFTLWEDGLATNGRTSIVTLRSFFRGLLLRFVTILLCILLFLVQVVGWPIVKRMFYINEYPIGWTSYVLRWTSYVSWMWTLETPGIIHGHRL